MKILPSRTARGATAAVASLALVAGAGVAAAQLPGDGFGGYVVKVDDPSLQVTVTKTGNPPTGVTGTITNTTGSAFYCAVPQFDKNGQTTPLGHGQVTTAAAAREVIDYYRSGVFTGPADTNANGDLISFGSLYDVMPTGSAIGSAEADTRQAHNEAVVAGRAGDPRVNNALQFTVNGGQSVTYTATLGDPATGDRGEWRAAAIFMCRNNTTNEWSLFTGLEDIEDPNPPAVEPAGTGSLSSGLLGS